MTIGVRPFFKLNMRRVWGEARFERKGHGRLPAPVAASETKLGGPATQQLVKNIAAAPAYWQAFLAQALSGPDRTRYLASIKYFGSDPAISPTHWEAAAGEAELQPLRLDEAGEREVSPGAQLFALASNLSGLGLLAALSRSSGVWQDESSG